MPTFGTPSYAGSDSAASSLDVPAPGDLQDGDLLIVALRSQSAGGTTPWSAPAGFVPLSAEEVLPSPGARIGRIWGKEITSAAAEPASYTFTGSSGRLVAIAVACRSELSGTLARVDSKPYDVDGGGVDGIARVSAFPLSTLPAISLAAVGAECVSGVVGYPATTPDGFTEIGSAQSSLDGSTSGSRTALWLGWRAEATDPASGFAGGYPGGSGVGLYHGAFVGAGVEPDPDPDPPAPGFRSVAQMFATQGATWAHRGGSASWPEGSELAFLSAARAGYGALEISCARTSDGVWFGLHDRDMNRTSQTTGLPWASEMTWAEVQEYQITLNAAGNPQPYWRLDDFLDTYGRTHVCILDFKHAATFADEMYALAAAKADRQKVVIKYHGPTTFAPSIATRVAAEGWASWGYYYEENVTDGSLAATQGDWTILGMDLAASQSAWDAVLAYGKPVVGHIAATQAQYDTAIAKGAHMVQCSGAAVIDAVGPPANPQPWDAIYALGQRVPARTVSRGSIPIWP